jgi:hypothetical protein
MQAWPVSTYVSPHWGMYGLSGQNYNEVAFNSGWDWDSASGKLFVNAINGPDGAKREIFLNNVFSDHHDIFFANIGGRDIEGLTATLTNAQGIRLDDYWTVNDDVLRPLASANIFVQPGYTGFSSNARIYQNNVGKIRIVRENAGGVGSLHEDDISGTLTISADGHEDIVIELTGSAGNPRLTTDNIPSAVRFVPYTVQIMHNNKYPWNTVSMQVPSGQLPPGLTLRPNGELYGVPTQAGTFNFTVTMSNSDARLGGP